MKDLTETIVHELWLNCNGRTPKAVIREIVWFQYKWLRTAFKEKKNVHINGLGDFGVKVCRIKFFEELGETIKKKLNDKE